MNRLVIPMVILCTLVGCSKKQETNSQQQPITQQPRQQQTLRSGTSNQIAGIRWTVPSRWTEGEARQMRVATYIVPSTARDQDAGECAVFYFGRNEGGGIDANIDRWVSQFENPSKPERSTKTVDGMNVTMVSVSGTYLALGGPTMQSQGKKENYRLLGAIVEAPDGLVFFKFTGPAKTVDDASGKFNDMIDSITKQSNAS